jgi:hypothetical protein
VRHLRRRFVGLKRRAQWELNSEQRVLIAQSVPAERHRQTVTSLNPALGGRQTLLYPAIPSGGSWRAARNRDDGDELFED